MSQDEFTVSFQLDAPLKTSVSLSAPHVEIKPCAAVRNGQVTRRRKNTTKYTFLHPRDDCQDTRDDVGK